MTVQVTISDITTEADAEALRVLRNECAGWMTRDTSQITPQQQEKFFRARIATGQVEGFLMSDGGEPVAYGLLVWDGQGRAWSSTGIKADRRGQGLGWLLTVENVRRARRRGVPIWAEVRADNAAQQRICRAIGYHVTESFTRDDGVDLDVMRCDELRPEYA